MAVFDDAIFNLVPGDLIQTGTSSTMTSGVGGVVFPEAGQYTFQPSHTEATTDWAVITEVDPLATGAVENVQMSDWDIYGPYIGMPDGADELIDLYVVTLGTTTTPRGVTEPPDPAVRLATVHVGTFPAYEGERYYLHAPFFKPTALGPYGPDGYWHMYTWLDEFGDPIGTIQQSSAPSNDQPANYYMGLHDLGEAPAGTYEVKVELGVWPHYFEPLNPGSKIGFWGATLFAESPSLYYDTLLNTGWQGGTEAGLFSGRRSDSAAGKTVIAGLDGTTASGAIANIDSPVTPAYTIVAGFVTSSSGEILPNWSFSYDTWVAAAYGGLNTIVNPNTSNEVPVVRVGGTDGIIGIAVTVDTSETPIAEANFYDMSGFDEPLFSYAFGTTGSDDPYQEGLVFLNGASGLIRMTVWDRILSPAELQEAIEGVTGLVPRNVSWVEPNHSGGSPITGYVVSAYNGATVQEFEVGVDVTTMTLPASTVAAQVAAVNAIGRSTPAEITF